MAEKNLNVRISLKYDTYANWIANNPVLKVGEMALCTVPTEDTNGVSTDAIMFFSAPTSSSAVIFPSAMETRLANAVKSAAFA